MEEAVKNIERKLDVSKKYILWVQWTLMGLLILGVAFALIFSLAFNNLSEKTEKDFNISFDIPKDIVLGEPFSFKINFENNSDKVIKNASAVLDIPQGLILEKEIDLNLGDIAPFVKIEKKFKALALDSQSIGLSVFYQSAWNWYSTRIFEKRAEADIAIQGKGISLEVLVPDEIISGERFKIEFLYENKGDFDFEKVNLHLNLPSQFVVEKASPSPEKGLWSKENRIEAAWYLDKLIRRSQGKFAVQGYIQEKEGVVLNVKAFVEASFWDKEFVINEKTAIFQVVPRPLFLEISANDTASLGQGLTYNIRYYNTTASNVENLNIKAKLSGSMFDFKTIKTSGFFNSLDNTITWNPSNNSDLHVLGPRQGGEVSFSIKVKSIYPADKNLVLKTEARINSPTIPENMPILKNESLASSETKIAGSIALKTGAYFKETKVWINNKGSLPLKVNTPTDLTIHWLIYSYAADMNKIRIYSTLPEGISWTNVVHSNINSKPVYHEATNEVVWEIDKISANRGVINEPVRAVFQIRAIPNVTQVDKDMTLINKTSLQAQDSFTQRYLTAQQKALTVFDLGDPYLSKSQKKVIP